MKEGKHHLEVVSLAKRIEPFGGHHSQLGSIRLETFNRSRWERKTERSEEETEEKIKLENQRRDGSRKITIPSEYYMGVGEGR